MKTNGSQNLLINIELKKTFEHDYAELTKHGTLFLEQLQRRVGTRPI